MIRAYNDETENAIDVEFHDTRTHHSIHISNVDKYTMADMSDQAVVLASEATDDGPRYCARVMSDFFRALHFYSSGSEPGLTKSASQTWVKPSNP